MKEQSVYLEEAKMRNEKYRRFQHDIDNHLLVLSGLIHEKKYEEAEIYFENLHKASDHLLIGIETGNPVIDILLNEKINYARSNGIEVKYDIRFSSDCPVEDLDLCVILANAMDNAITACMEGDIEHPEISIIIRKRHHFLILEIANPISWMENTPVYLQLQWFDTVEEVKVSSELRNKRWNTEITARDALYLEKLGMSTH